MQDRLRQLSADLLQRGVTLAILEGTFLVWWLRLACLQRFEPGGFEACLAHIGPLMQPIPPLLERLYDEIQDEGPMPEMKQLGDKVDRLKQHAGAWQSWPKSRDLAAVEQDLTSDRLQSLLVECLDQRLQPAVMESMLFYFVCFRQSCTIGFGQVICHSFLWLAVFRPSVPACGDSSKASSGRARQRVPGHAAAVR